jgi:hypothetical protein
LMGGAAPYLAPSVRFWFRVVPYSLRYCDSLCLIAPHSGGASAFIKDFPCSLYLHQRSSDFALACFPLKLDYHQD